MLPATARCSQRACREALKLTRRHAYLSTTSRPQTVTGIVQQRIYILATSRAYATAVKLPTQADLVARPASTPAEPTTNAPAPQRALPNLLKLDALVEQTRTRFLSADGLPSTQLTAVALKTLGTAAAAIKPHLKRRESRPRPNTLFGLSQDDSGEASVRVKRTADKIFNTAQEIFQHPNVEIDTEVLARYVDVQCLLGRPETLPDAFDQFVAKPLPKMSSGQVVYKKRFLKRPTAAIDAKIAEKALDAAIAVKDLDVAIQIVEKAYKGTPFLLHKIQQTATAPAVITAMVPFGIYALSKQFASLHPSIDTDMATRITFAGVTAYIIFTASLGMFAKAFTMDHMTRVTWQHGTPIRERWLREQERAGLDKIAIAWGFKEKWRYGEEVGPEWMALREYIGQRRMILDKLEFMEGMNP